MSVSQSLCAKKMFSVLCAFTLFYSTSSCSCLYEDQIGKFEWRQLYVGKPILTELDVASPIKKVIVGTEQNVLAAIHLKTGNIIWRHIFESGEVGKIRALSVHQEITTITGVDTPLVRGWDAETGYLIWEWSITKHGEHTKWFITRHKIVQIDLAAKSQIKVTLFNGRNGKSMESEVVPSPWLIPENCVLQGDALGCMTSDKLVYSIKLTNRAGDLDVKVHHMSLLDLFEEEVTGNLKEVVGTLPVATINVGHVERPILLQPELTAMETGDENFKFFATTSYEDYNIVASAILKNDELVLESRDLSGQPVKELCSSVPLPKDHGYPERLQIVCQPKKDGKLTCRMVIVTTHDVLLVVQYPGKILWVREEALSSIITAEMVELPASDTDAAIEKEFENRNIPDAESSRDWLCECEFV